MEISGFQTINFGILKCKISGANELAACELQYQTGTVRSLSTLHAMIIIAFPGNLLFAKRREGHSFQKWYLNLWIILDKKRLYGGTPRFIAQKYGLQRWQHWIFWVPNKWDVHLKLTNYATRTSSKNCNMSFCKLTLLFNLTNFYHEIKH